MRNKRLPIGNSRNVPKHRRNHEQVRLLRGPFDGTWLWVAKYSNETLIFKVKGLHGRYIRNDTYSREMTWEPCV